MIKHITYHILEKQQGDKHGEILLNPDEIEPNAAHQNFLDTLSSAYKGRAGKGFGGFDTDTDNFPMPRLLEDYLLDNDFRMLAERMMNVLKTKINAQLLATGGKVFITHYEENGHDYMLIAILSDKVGFSATDWQLTESEMLDIEHLKFAGRIDLSKWQAAGTAAERYISFLKGQGEIAGYFREFLGCNDIVQARTETDRLVKTLEAFANEQGLDVEAKTAFFTRTQTYLKEISDNNEPFVAATFANRVWSECPQNLSNKLANDDCGIADGFIPDKTALRKLRTYSARTKNWRLSFDREAIANGQILAQDGKIIIDQPPQDLLDAFSNFS